MADFCKQCSVEMFGEDMGDLRSLGDPSALKDGEGWAVTCEGCGYVVVDNDGACIADWCSTHGKNPDPSTNTEIKLAEKKAIQEGREK